MALAARLAARLTSQRAALAPVAAAIASAGQSTALHRAMSTTAAPSAVTNKDSAMFCFQCEQTEGAKGCKTVGVCGKTPEVAHLQDGLVHALKGLAHVAGLARSVGVKSDEVDRFWLLSMFSTLTNVDFNPADFHKSIPQAIKYRDELYAKYAAACEKQGKAPERLTAIASWAPAALDGKTLEAEGAKVGVKERATLIGEEAAGLQELIAYGIKGAAAYASHAMLAGSEKMEGLYQGLYKSTTVLSQNETDIGKLVAAAMEVGALNVNVMAALDEAHTTRYGHPEPTAYNTQPVAGKCIVVSGHDLVDLEEVLKQTEGKGINVYTHGEMLPAHGYPNLKKYKHLVGNYGGAWQLQKLDFAAFQGSILITSNCIMEPRPSYKGRIFTTNAVGFPGVTHIPAPTAPDGKRDFSALIQSALAAPGFKETKPAKTNLTGFGHNAVLGVAPAVLEAASKGDLQRLVLIGGCDGSESERSYYTRLATSLPDQAAILTLGCGKYRVLGKKQYGNVPNTQLPRVLDMGQCNDSYSAVVVASALAKALKTDVNGLPLSIVLSWLEQKAVAVLLSLLSLGVKNIRIGPSLPAFVTPATLDVLVKNFNLTPISNPESDAEFAKEVASVMGKK